MNSVVHFELPSRNRDRTAKFYTQAFGWKATKLGPEMDDYVLATTTESDESGHPKRPGAINGGFFKLSADKPAQYPSVVIAVEDVAQAMKDVMEAGGKVLGKPVEIPGYGLYVSFFDTEGNRVAMMQPKDVTGIHALGIQPERLTFLSPGQRPGTLANTEQCSLKGCGNRGFSQPFRLSYS